MTRKRIPAALHRRFTEAQTALRVALCDEDRPRAEWAHDVAECYRTIAAIYDETRDLRDGIEWSALYDAAELLREKADRLEHGQAGL